MKKWFYLLSMLVCVLQLFCCKKNQQKPQLQTQSYDLKATITRFSVNGEFIPSNIDTIKNTITVTVPSTVDMHNLTINFALSPQIKAAVNNVAVNTGAVLDLSKLSIFTLTSPDNKQSYSFQLYVQSDLQYIGLIQYGGHMVAENSLNKSYDYYFDQFDGSTYQGINCGPTVSTMALKWADSTFSKKPVDARIKIPESGGWWSTGDIVSYLSYDNINTSTVPLNDINGVVKTAIDAGDMVILCLDMSFVPDDDVYYHHVQKFYVASSTGWGHFLLVKGYRQTNNDFFLEINDPYSQGEHYGAEFNFQPRGEDRFYVSSDIKRATDNWWPFAIIAAPQGKQVTASSKLTINSTQIIPLARGR